MAREPGSKPRSLLVNLSGTRDEVLKKSHLVRQYEGWENIYIDPDRTPNERQFYVALREELKVRRSRGETDLIIRNGQIVHRRETPLEVPIQQLNSPAASVAPTASSVSNIASTSTETITNQEAHQVRQESQPQNVAQSDSPINEDTSVSDNTLVEIEVPELPRANEEEEEDGQGYMTCTQN